MLGGTGLHGSIALVLDDLGDSLMKDPPASFVIVH